jgi:hypothetical protein
MRESGAIAGIKKVMQELATRSKAGPKQISNCAVSAESGSATRFLPILIF